MKDSPFIKVYKSYGSSTKATVFGHVLTDEQPEITASSNLAIINLASLLRLFSLEVLPDVTVKLDFYGQSFFTKTENDGFFKFEIALEKEPPSGWNTFKISLVDDNASVKSTIQYGQIFFPQRSKYVYISDIDDTIMKSYSATILKRLYELIRRNPRKRRLFDNTAVFYNALAESNVVNGVQNPFFYVSSSEWNLYEYLNIVFSNHKMSNGIFLLNTIKKSSSFVSTGKSGHEGKMIRIARIILTLNEGQQFILLGDNSQKDPEIYCAIADKYSTHIKAVLIRNVVEANKEKTQKMLNELPENIEKIQFKTTQEAITFSRSIGLIHDR